MNMTFKADSLTDKFYNMETAINNLTKALSNTNKKLNDMEHIGVINKIQMYDSQGHLITLTDVSCPTLELDSNSMYGSFLANQPETLTFTAQCGGVQVSLRGETDVSTALPIKTRFRNFSSKKVKYHKNSNFID